MIYHFLTSDRNHGLNFSPVQLLHKD